MIVVKTVVIDPRTTVADNDKIRVRYCVVNGSSLYANGLESAFGRYWTASDVRSTNSLGSYALFLVPVHITTYGQQHRPDVVGSL